MAVSKVAGSEVLRISLSGPSAHFRIIQSNNPRNTYPLPPYSTVIGILANILGDQIKIDSMLKKSFALGILSQYESVTNDYTWMRNMSPDFHKDRFYTITNRMWQDAPEHPGGQIPIIVRILNEVKVWIYLYHTCNETITTLEQNISHPEKWLSHLHLGRAEDWATPDGLSRIKLTKGTSPADFSKSSSYYQWMPDYSSNNGKNVFWPDSETVPEGYKKLYDKMSGSVVLVTTVYQKVNIKQGEGKKTATIRNFNHIAAKICNSQIPWLSIRHYPSLYYDPELKTPVYLARINPSQEVFMDVTRDISQK